MSDIPYKIAGKTSKPTRPVHGQTFPNVVRPGSVQTPSTDPQQAYATRQWRKIILSLANAQTTDYLVTMSGAALWLIQGTNTTDTVQIFFNNDTDSIPFSPGNYVIGFPFYQLRFQWSAQSNDNVTIMVTDVWPGDDFRVM